jgi:hypothetical protein
MRGATFRISEDEASYSGSFGDQPADVGEDETAIDPSGQAYIGQIQNRVEIMKPHFGGAMVLIDPNSKLGSFTTKENIDTFSVGLEQSRLRPIIDKLV